MSLFDKYHSKIEANLDKIKDLLKKYDWYINYI